MNLVSSTTKDTQKSYLSPRQVVLDAGQVEVFWMQDK